MPKKYKVYITRAAQQDIEEIWEYISNDSIHNAASFIDKVEKHIFSLEMHPERNPLIPENKILHGKYRHMVYKKYRIIYRIQNRSVFTLRIIHGSRLFHSDMLE